MIGKNRTEDVDGAEARPTWARHGVWVGITCVVAFAVLSICVVGRPGNALDHRVFVASPGTQNWAVARWMIHVRQLGEPSRAAPLGAVLMAIGAVFRRTRRATLLAGLVFFTGILVGTLLKYALGQDGPPVVDGPPVDNGTAYPSGHTIVASLMYPAAAAVMTRAVPKSIAPVVLAGGVAVALVVGLCQILLRTHWFSDVVAAWLFSAAWWSLAAVVGQRLVPAGWIGPQVPVGRRRRPARHL